MSDLLRKLIVTVTALVGAAIGATIGLLAAVLVLGVAARVGEISMGVAFLGGLVGAVAGGVIAWSIARRLTRPSSEGP